MTITFPNNTTEIIDEIRAAIGRPVEFFYVASSVACPVCTLDPITNESTDAFCVVCSGTYWIEVYNTYTVSGHITWGPLETLGWQTGGQFLEGDGRVQVKYTEELLTVLDTTKYLIVDGKTVDIKNKIYRGATDLNRILLNVKERE